MSKHKIIDLLYHDFGYFYNIDYEPNIKWPDHGIIPFVCIDTQMLITELQILITQFRDKCINISQNIIFFLHREFVPVDVVNKITQLLSLCPNSLLTKIKIIVNGYTNYIESKYKHVFLNINFFDRYLYMLSEMPLEVHGQSMFLIKKTYDHIINERQYKFSTFIGQISRGRYHRAKYFYKCFNEYLLDEDHFWSLICIDYFDTMRTFQHAIGNKETNNIQHMIKHKVVKENGDFLTSSDHIYNDHYEYQVPEQMRNSYINVVLETTEDIPCVTEKIYKPIIAGIPFIWYGNKNICNFLTRQGYKLYPFIDYTFDSIDSSQERLNVLIQEMKRLKLLNLKQLIHQTLQISTYNRYNFFNNAKYMSELQPFLL